jgi:hypothetical protein
MLQLREPRHPTFAGVDQVDDLLVRHLVLYPRQRRKCREDTFPLFAVADGTVVCIFFCAFRISRVRGGALVCACGWTRWGDAFRSRINGRMLAKTSCKS